MLAISRKHLETKKIGKILVAAHDNFIPQSLWATAVLRKAANKCSSVDDIVRVSFQVFNKFPFKYLGWSIYPQQVKEELTQFLKIVASQDPKTVLEIGTSTGGTLFALSKLVNPQSLIISIDLPGGKFGGGYSGWRTQYYKSFATKRQSMKLVRQNSHSKSTLQKIKNILAGRKLDLLFIDGDHTYLGVKRDFEIYSGLVRKGGIIAFHDIAVEPPESGCEVHKFWAELKRQFPHKEIIENPNQGWAGIGIIYQ
jgi:predicted O-methyltransferase YrrM